MSKFHQGKRKSHEFHLATPPPSKKYPSVCMWYTILPLRLRQRPGPSRKGCLEILWDVPFYFQFVIFHLDAKRVKLPCLPIRSWFTTTSQKWEAKNEPAILYLRMRNRMSTNSVLMAGYQFKLNWILFASSSGIQGGFGSREFESEDVSVDIEVLSYGEMHNLYFSINRWK